MLKCRQCGAPLSNDEVGLTRKLINRGTDKFMCLGCLGEFFGATRERLIEMIGRFRAQGCTLFAPKGTGI